MYLTHFSIAFIMEHLEVEASIGIFNSNSLLYKKSVILVWDVA